MALDFGDGTHCPQRDEDAWLRAQRSVVEADDAAGVEGGQLRRGDVELVDAGFDDRSCVCKSDWSLLTGVRSGRQRWEEIAIEQGEAVGDAEAGFGVDAETCWHR